MGFGACHDASRVGVDGGGESEISSVGPFLTISKTCPHLSIWLDHGPQQGGYKVGVKKGDGLLDRVIDGCELRPVLDGERWPGGYKMIRQQYDGGAVTLYVTDFYE